MKFDVGEFLIVIVILVISTVLHEMAHGGVAYLLGDTTAKENGRLSLNPLKHIDPYMSILVPIILYLLGGPIFGGAKPVPVDSRKLKWGPWGMALVAIAGPLTNFLLAFGVFLIGYFSGAFISEGGELYYSGQMGYILEEAMFINLGFGIFNLIPIPPLDGSRILYAIAPDGARRFLEGVEKYGMIIVLVLVMIFSSALSRLLIGGMNGILDFFRFIVGA
ncbi:site-2 protease family protein [Candidatus Saccharibacteria bacterium]|nr:site-2 protease family protein [Candidatus Saccharibacteria bacterium]